MFLFCCLLALLSVQEALAAVGALPRTSDTPVNVDPKLDCALKELAWQYGKKLQPWRGSFESAYDALQLSSCNTSLSRQTVRHSSTAFHGEGGSAGVRKAASFYVDATAGDDGNPGTVDKPVRTIMEAVSLFRAGKKQLTDSGVIYLKAGTYYLTETIDLGQWDSYLTIMSLESEKAVISGGKLYHFDGAWKEVANEMSRLHTETNAVHEAVGVAGESNRVAKYHGTVSSARDCQTACEKDDTCFAFTWHDSTMGSFKDMCYFRIDGLWVPTSQAGAVSGKKLDVVVVDLSDQDPIPFTSLFINGRRAIRARYPDGNPETMGLHTMPTGYVSSAVNWLTHAPRSDATEVVVETPQRNGTHFPVFRIGIGGAVSEFEPPESYWGSKDPIGGLTYSVPSGLQYSPEEDIANRTWKTPQTGVVHAFHCGHWGNWQFRISSRDMEKQEIVWSYGGFQEARGCGSGAEWYVENIREELDAPGEWFFDEADNKLYLYPNKSAPSTGVGTVLDRLINIRGSLDSPVHNISLVNITFAHTATTFLSKYEVPSGGDWSIHRGGAVFAENVDGFHISSCVFDSPGGNGLFLSNFVRNAIVERNEFKYTGDSAIAAIGSSNLVDGSDGSQPRGTVVYGNVMHEIGVFGKQTSAYVQSLSCQTQFIGNAFFNGPRAGINFNDGFGGGNQVSNNLGFNMVRETEDHGPFNSWDRQPYITTVNDGMTPSLTPATSNMTRNFFINNYHSTFPIDHDDGSCYYYDSFNVLVYGGYKNYLGHTKTVKNNVYIYPDAKHELISNTANPQITMVFCASHNGASTGSLASGWGETWANNICIIGNPNVYHFETCSPFRSNDGLVPFTANNSFYAPNQYIYIMCGGEQLSLSEYQSMGYDIGSEVYDVVDYDTIINWGKQILNF